MHQPFMRRTLALLLSLAIVAGAVAAMPGLDCVSDAPTVGGPQHACCGERMVSSAPAASCRVLSQPAGERTLTARRGVTAKDRVDHVAPPVQLVWANAVHHRWHQLSASKSPPARAVPIYLQHRSLLI